MKPSYYDSFNCIADKCDFTCCQEWKISVDEETLKKWEKTGITLKTEVKDCVNVISLGKNRKCPCLTGEGLCSIVLKHGEEYISNTCHIFPRETHTFQKHVEQTLMPGCPHVVDILNNEDRFKLTECFEGEYENELFALRQRMIDFIQGDFYKDELSVEESLMIMNYILLDYYEADQLSMKNWNLISDISDAIRNMKTDKEDSLNECNELFLDVVDNYRKEGIYEGYLLPMCDEAEKIEEKLQSGECDNIIRQYKAFNSEWNLYNELIRKIIAEEFYSELILPNEDGDDICDIEGFIVKYQWISMEYVVLKHMCFLKYLIKQSKGFKLEYEDIKESIVLTWRMTGYDEADIYEYLENSFESLVWEWGYTALIMS